MSSPITPRPTSRAWYLAPVYWAGRLVSSVYQGFHALFPPYS